MNVTAPFFIKFDHKQNGRNKNGSKANEIRLIMWLIMIWEAGEGGFKFFGDQTERSNPPLSSETLRNIKNYALRVPIFTNG